MPRRQKDPVIDVINYFESASLDSAKTALSLAREIVQRRTGSKPVIVKKATKKAPAVPGPVAQVGD
jgi:hypothetical protein